MMDDGTRWFAEVLTDGGHRIKVGRRSGTLLLATWSVSHRDWVEVPLADNEAKFLAESLGAKW